jgi:hypothetical protein
MHSKRGKKDDSFKLSWTCLIDRWRLSCADGLGLIYIPSSFELERLYMGWQEGTLLIPPHP